MPGIGKLFTSAHALSQRRQPMHRVVSTRIPKNSSPSKTSWASDALGVKRAPPAAPASPTPIVLKNVLLSILPTPLYKPCFSFDRLSPAELFKKTYRQFEIFNTCYRFRYFFLFFMTFRTFPALFEIHHFMAPYALAMIR